MFEVFGQGLARAGMCWSQLARIDQLCKKSRVGGKKNSKKKGQSDPIYSFFFEIYLFNLIFWEIWGMGQGFWENGCTSPPFFEACPYT
jgi:hypothetical protein